ncbi:MAG: DUF4307 domain-containing protein [Corynebacterium sp.]|uniref:DUF4307 domain-containing protein n=1 Tax=Corynebacterium sp. TaxID=1720 RepID=UPI002649262A|nr:DUF4307 domain-containing protein [Corynebacterium sp.]MDN6281411.1 DUF4307 domain-containing protein [Corynebacterium sp.]
MSKATYGSARSDGVSGKIIVIGIVIFTVAVGIYVFSQWNNSTSSDTSGTIAGYEAVEGEDALRLTVDITRDDSDKPALCIITALDESTAEVGRREAVVAAGGSDTTRLVVDVPTHTNAAAGDVYGCSTVFPSYLDDSVDPRAVQYTSPPPPSNRPHPARVESEPSDTLCPD